MFFSGEGLQGWCYYHQSEADVENRDLITKRCLYISLISELTWNHTAFSTVKGSNQGLLNQPESYLPFSFHSCYTLKIMKETAHISTQLSLQYSAGV